MFWKLGYTATSIQHLVDAMGIERGSLYRTYGNKEQLFRKAVEHYSRHQAARMPQGAPPLAMLRAYFDNNLEDTQNRQLPNGCLVINSAVETPALPKRIQKLVHEHITNLRTFFRGCIEAAIATCQLPRSVAPDEQADALLAAIIGINVMSRAGTPHAQLERIANAALSFI